VPARRTRHLKSSCERLQIDEKRWISCQGCVAATSEFKHPACVNWQVEEGVCPVNAAQRRGHTVPCKSPTTQRKKARRARFSMADESKVETRGWRVGQVSTRTSQSTRWEGCRRLGEIILQVDSKGRRLATPRSRAKTKSNSVDFFISQFMLSAPTRHRWCQCILSRAAQNMAWDWGGAGF